MGKGQQSWHEEQEDEAELQAFRTEFSNGPRSLPQPASTWARPRSLTQACVSTIAVIPATVLPTAAGCVLGQGHFSAPEQIAKGLTISAGDVGLGTGI